ncbi:hypothetical protein [Psychromarinibacter sp. S121]|uniref:hypothetical protein n=1 Tax=Psychromarinibacter sp. S121 TaxID=3415127 RepID=UPI003C7C3958
MTVETTRESWLWVKVLLAAWLVAWLGSFAAFWMAPNDDLGLTRSWNKLRVLMLWQGVATLFAMLCAVQAPMLPRGSRRRRAAYLPLGVLVATVAGASMMALWAGMA